METAGARELRPWLEAVAAIATALNRPLSLAEILDRVAETAARLLGYDFCAVLLHDEGAAKLIITGSYGLSPAYVHQVNADHPVVLEPDDEPQAPSSRAFLTGRSVQVVDTAIDATFMPWGGVAREQGYRSMISVPLTAHGVPVGTLNCYSRVPHEFGDDEQELLQLLADQACVAIETARLRDREAATIAALVSANTTLAAQHELLRRGEEVHSQLTDVALRGGGVAGLAGALAELLGAPVVVAEEPSGAELARGGPPDADEGGSACGPRSTPVMLAHETVARIWVARDDDLSPIDVRALEHAATVCALEMLRARSALEVEWRVSGEIVSDLLTGNAAGLATAAERARRLGHDLAAPHGVIVVRVDGKGPGASARPLSVARSMAATAQPRALVSSIGDDVVLLWSAASVDSLRERAVELQRQLRRVDSSSVTSVAVSPLCTAFSDYPAAYRRARGAVAIAGLRGEHGSVASVDSLGVHGLLLQLEDVSELRRFAAEMLAPVREHDAARGTALEETLRVYIAHDLNTAATGAALFVHPNTVGLRVRKAEQLLGLSIARVQSLSELQVALSADDVADALVGRGHDR